jgi:DNA-binding transcriptional MerR regulator/methylmalonyl-CoA mutase cobalamin-binding subunit
MRISELSRRVGVGAETLRAWERRYGVLQPRRTAGNTRLYSALDEARVRVMKRYIAQRLPVAQAAEMAMAARLRLSPGQTDAVPEHEVQRSIEALGSALESFDETAADRTLQQLLGAFSPSAVLRDVVLPYLHDVGERWADAHLSVAQEHFASYFFQARIQALARGWDRGLGPRAVLAAAPEDHHTLGLACFGIALHRLGWRIVALGAATPIEMVAQVASSTNAQLIAISTSLPGGLDAYADGVRRLAEHAPVILGGCASDPSLAQRCGARHLDDPIAGAIAVAVNGDA